jgi:S-adenosylmethionine:tRNA ribosyltransferase-isomerase
MRPSTTFELPPELAARQPPEARGLARDQVRLLVAGGPAGGETGIQHTRFAELGRFLDPGDLLVVNTSATRPAAVTGHHPRLGPVVVHFSTDLDDGTWVVELRSAPDAARPISEGLAGTRVMLPAGGSLLLTAEQAPGRLWRGRPLGTLPIPELLRTRGRPIRYGYLGDDWPLETYQTVFAREDDRAAPGASAEMPSAGRAFSRALVTDLIGGGIRFAPITLHCGVSSLESHEPPQPERFAVPAATAALVNHVHDRGRRVVAVGTTVTRALESVADASGTVQPGAGWTDLVLGPARAARAVDGLVTGLHDPEASHLLLLEAVAGPARVQRVYDAAVDGRYLWHEFGDTCLLLSPRGERSGPDGRAGERAELTL